MSTIHDRICEIRKRFSGSIRRQPSFPLFILPSFYTFSGLLSTSRKQKNTDVERKSVCLFGAVSGRKSFVENFGAPSMPDHRKYLIIATKKDFYIQRGFGILYLAWAIALWATTGGKNFPPFFLFWNEYQIQAMTWYEAFCRTACSARSEIALPFIPEYEYCHRMHKVSLYFCHSKFWLYHKSKGKKVKSASAVPESHAPLAALWKFCKFSIPGVEDKRWHTPRIEIRGFHAHSYKISLARSIQAAAGVAYDLKQAGDVAHRIAPDNTFSQPSRRKLPITTKTNVSWQSKIATEHKTLHSSIS